MKIKELDIKGVYLIEPTLFEDARGYFFESYNQQVFEKETGLSINFVQDNQSQSQYGVVRGLHYQKSEWGQAKLVRTLEGTILDVIVDLRVGSASFGKHLSVELSADNKKQLFVPRGFAHGFSVLSQTAVVHYKADNYYNKVSESGVHYADPELAINWGLKKENMIVSDKDIILPKLSDIKV